MSRSDRAMQAGYVFMSADYTLLPPATGHRLIEDIKDLFSYIQDTLNEDLESNGCSARVDSTSIAVAGSSAGGLCAYLSAIHAHPRPKAVLSLYGMGGDFFVSQFLRLESTGETHAATAFQTPQYLNIKTEPFFIGREMLDPEDFRQFLYPFLPSLQIISGSPLEYHPIDHPTKPGWPSNPRMPLCRLLLQEGVFLDYYTGEHEPSISSQWRSVLKEVGDEDEDVFAKENAFRDLIPDDHLELFPQVLVDSAFPPTFLLHGACDTAVRLRESLNMKRLLDAYSIRNTLKIVEGEEHSFDYASGAMEKHSAIFDDVFAFLLSCLEA